jgi:hypothetical protein
LLLDHIRALLGDHHDGRVDVAVGDGRHDGGVDHPEALDPVNPELGIDDGHGVVGRAHLRGAAHVVYRHGVLPDGAVPVLVRVRGQVLAVGQGLVVKSGPESSHGRGPAEGYRRLHALSQDVHVVRVGQVIVVHEGVVQGIARAELDEPSGLWPQHHGEDAEDVPVVYLAEDLVVEGVRQPVCVLHVGAAVRVGGRTRYHELDVGPVVARISIFRRNEADRLEADARR